MLIGKKISLIFISLAVISAFFYFDFQKSKREFLEVVFFNVGQGDSALIKTANNKNILIDGGPPGSGIAGKIDDNLAFFDKEIDLMILTHPHDDHAGGLLEVFDYFEVENILYSGAISENPFYLAWLDRADEEGVEIFLARDEQKINLGGDAFLEIIYDGAEARENLNNASVVVKLIKGEKSFLFTGDVEEEIEKKIISEEANLKADVLKVAHHGSDTSTGLDFLEMTSPQIAFISVGKENDFGHPSRRVLGRLERAGVLTFISFEEGDLKIYSDGKNIWR